MPEPQKPETELRIIGGHLRGRKIQYHGRPGTRPMKERLREAIFNLVSTEVKGRLAIDLFAGTGAIGLEALSRGANHVIFIEKHVPTAKLVRQNFESLDVADDCTLYETSAFLWGKRDLPELAQKAVDPWIVFCSPPYSFYVEREPDMLALLGAIVQSAPSASLVIVEADERFDFDRLPTPASAEAEPAGRRAGEGAWRIRDYSPARVGVLRLPA